jgi:2-keto-4-pentenoate hydratase/2-oxohepta-3-ene-1,7-dioic acid hydratase in catechol pathway
MKLVTFTHQGQTRIGVVKGDAVADICAASNTLPREMVAFLSGEREMRDGAQRAAESAPQLPLGQVKLEAPVPRPPEFLAIGLNYADHVAETGMQKPAFPIFFNKQSSCVNAPYDPIHLPRASEALDYEGELGFVIGRRCRHVSRDRASEVIGGYFIVNDVSVRDWQRRAQTMTLGKSFDTHGPIGPWIVTADEIGDPHSLELKTFVNGELRQHSNTRNLIFNCFEQVEVLSTVFTLQPGTLVSTGTPGGVAAAMKPPKWLKAGDVVRIEIDRIGYLEHRVIAEPDRYAGAIQRMEDTYQQPEKDTGSPPIPPSASGPGNYPPNIFDLPPDEPVQTIGNTDKAALTRGGGYTDYDALAREIYNSLTDDHGDHIAWNNDVAALDLDRFDDKPSHTVVIQSGMYKIVQAIAKLLLNANPARTSLRKDGTYINPPLKGWICKYGAPQKAAINEVTIEEIEFEVNEIGTSGECAFRIKRLHWGIRGFIAHW